jgi:hydroxyacylglutathione hydrolase
LVDAVVGEGRGSKRLGPRFTLKRVRRTIGLMRTLNPSHRPAPPSMFFEQHLIGAMQNFGYVIGDPAAKAAAVIDPSFDARILQKVADENGYAIGVIFDTHHHRDHVFDNERLASETGAKVAAHRLSEVRKDLVLEDGMIVKVGELKVKVVHTPGHSPDSCCFIVAGSVFTGDCLFVGDCGRVDLPGSSVEQMYDSLFSKVRKMDDALVVCPGHHYGKSPTSTIGEEKRTNYTLQPRTVEEFKRFMRTP